MKKTAFCLLKHASSHAGHLQQMLVSPALHLWAAADPDAGLVPSWLHVSLTEQAPDADEALSSISHRPAGP